MRKEKAEKRTIVVSKHSRLSKLILFFMISFTSLVLFFFISLALLLITLPNPTKLETREIPQTTKIMDRNGKLLYEIYASENRSLIPIKDIPDLTKKAFISMEDKDFYTHGGLAPRGLIRAVRETLLHGNLQGGSTITQQLIKSSLLTPERTIQRKLKEIFLAFLVEQKYSKDQILEMYLNQVPFGGTAYGIESAAETYFGKQAKNLDLGESALIAGLTAAPTYYSPFGAHPELAKVRQEEVLQRMVEDKHITQIEADVVKKESLNYKKPEIGILAPHFVLYVKDLLVKKYGEQKVEQGGLKVTTSLDLNLQQFAQDTVASEVAKLKNLNVGNGAALVTRPSTGEILTMVGSKDYFDKEYDGNVNVTTSLRQPGSSIKPINYAVGLSKGYTPATVFNDAPTCFNVPGQKPYCPVNYDGKFHGVVQMRFALGNSFNIPAVKMLAVNTVHDMIASASAMGISTLTDESRYGLSLTLGGGEVTMIDMATAFGVFANAGIRKDLVSILKVEDSKGKILDEYKDQNLESSPSAQNKPISSLAINGPRVLSADVAFLISHILLDNNARITEFGDNSLLKVPGKTVSVKTGTTDDKRDNWTIGYTPSFLTAVWVGNNDNKPMNQFLASGITGAAPIWNKIMTYALKDSPDESPKQPEGIIGKEICAFSGLLKGNSNCPIRYEYFVKGTEPKTTEDGIKQKVFIDKTTNKLAKPGQTDNVEEREVLMLEDPYEKKFCASCPVN
jgi:penicillin-binding protein 1C